MKILLTKSPLAFFDWPVIFCRYIVVPSEPNHIAFCGWLATYELLGGYCDLICISII
jgi:hypothetical protein